MLAIMERFLVTASGGDPEDLDRIRDFVEKSPDVQVVVSPAVAPFLDEDLDEGVKQLLLFGFIVGDAASQLRTGVARSDWMSGVEGELAIYLMLKAQATTKLKGHNVVSPSLDAWLELRAKGKLREHVERMHVRYVPRDKLLDPRTSPPPRANPPSSKATPGDPDDEQRAHVAEAIRLVHEGKPQEAITGHLDNVLSSFSAKYANEKRRIYCSRVPAETLKYMLDSSNRGEEGFALDPTWAEAWFIKSYALTELNRRAEARAALEAAIALSPSYPQYLSELGYLHQRDKTWSAALKVFEEAESSVKLFTDPRQNIVQTTRALRGQGYALIELGDLDRAERAYQRSLALDPNDEISKKQLVYILGLREK